MEPKTDKPTAPAPTPEQATKDYRFKKNHQLDGKEVKSGEPRELPVKQGERLKKLGIVE